QLTCIPAGIGWCLDNADVRYPAGTKRLLHVLLFQTFREVAILRLLHLLAPLRFYKLGFDFVQTGGFLASRGVLPAENSDACFQRLDVGEFSREVERVRLATSTCFRIAGNDAIGERRELGLETFHDTLSLLNLCADALHHNAFTGILAKVFLFPSYQLVQQGE